METPREPVKVFDTVSVANVVYDYAKQLLKIALIDSDAETTDAVITIPEKPFCDFMRDAYCLYLYTDDQVMSAIYDTDWKFDPRKLAAEYLKSLQS